MIYLDVPTEMTTLLLRGREAATNTHADIHEQDTAYLAHCRETGRAAAAYYGWQVVQCVQGDRLRTPEEIHQEIYRLVQRCLEE